MTTSDGGDSETPGHYPVDSRVPQLAHEYTIFRETLLAARVLRMFAANLLNKLSAKYWGNVQRLRPGAGDADSGFGDNYYYTT